MDRDPGRKTHSYEWDHRDQDRRKDRKVTEGSRFRRSPGPGRSSPGKRRSRGGIGVGTVQYEINGHLGVEACRIECGDLDVRLPNDQREFRAPQNDSLSVVLSKVFDLIEYIPFARWLKDTHAKLFLDDPVQLIAYRWRGRHHDLDPVALFQPLWNEAILHCEFGPDEADLREVSTLDRQSGRICDMKNGYSRPAGHLRVDFVRGVSGEKDCLRSRRPQLTRGVQKNGCDLVPMTLELEIVELPLVQVVDDERRIRVVPEVVIDRLVDVSVILDGRMPRSATDQAEHPHFSRLNSLSRDCGTRLNRAHENQTQKISPCEMP